MQIFLFGRSAFLANTFVAPATMPGWLRRDRRVEPAVGHGRPRPASCSATPGSGGDSWAAQHALLLAVLWPLVIVAIFLPLSVLKYRNLSR